MSGILWARRNLNPGPTVLATLRALDRGDYNKTEYRKPVLEFRHRASSGTPLKKKEYGERDVPISDEIATVLDDYVSDRRKDITDDYGREPLPTTAEGRPFKTTLQRNLYAVTQSCYIGWDCPRDKDPNDCSWTAYNKASQCPDSVSPHGVRKTNVTHFRDLGFEYEETSDRVDASPEVLREHYDLPTTDEVRDRQFDMMDRLEELEE